MRRNGTGELCQYSLINLNESAEVTASNRGKPTKKSSEVFHQLEKAEKYQINLPPHFVLTICFCTVTTMTPLKQAKTLLIRDSVQTVSEQFTRKDNTLSLPTDGMSLLQTLSAHPLFGNLTIAFLDHVGEFNIGSNFTNVHDPSSFHAPTIGALVFDFAKNEASPFFFLGTQPKESPWSGPQLEQLLACDSSTAIISLLEDKVNHEVERPTSRTFVFCDPMLLDILYSEPSLTEDLIKLTFKIISLCKEKCITHHKNGKQKKKINQNTLTLLDFLLYNMIHEQNEVDIQPTNGDETDRYFESLGEIFDTETNHQPNPESVDVDMTEEPCSSTHGDNFEGIADQTLPTMDAEKEQDPMPAEEDLGIEEIPELPEFTLPRIPRKRRDVENHSDSDDSDSDSDIPEPTSKKARTPDRTTGSTSQAMHHIRAIARAYAREDSDEDILSDTVYGSRKNKLNKLNQFKINGILNACTPDCQNPAADIPASLIEMTENRSGPDLALYLEGTLASHNISVCIGFCTAILCGTLCNRTITSKNIQGFTIFAFGPREEEDETYHLQQSLLMNKNGISDDDKKKLLNQKRFIPSDVDGAKTAIRNTATMAKFTFGKRSFIATSIRDIKMEVRNADAFMKLYFKTHGTAFGHYFSQTIHAGISLFLNKASNGIQFMKPTFLDFSDFFMDIQTQRLRLAIDNVLINNDKKIQEGNSSHKAKGDEVKNHQKAKADCLSNDQYRRLFNYRVRQGVPPPKMENGQPICWNYHGKGTCKTNCNRKESHVRLNQTEITTWNTFIGALKGNLSGNQQMGNNAANERGNGR